MVKLCCISDMHGYLPDIQTSDILILAGDLCPWRDHSLAFQQLWLNSNFREWRRKQPVKSCVYISGNHDFIFEKNKFTNADLAMLADKHWMYYLEDSYTTVDGIKIWGSPWQLPFGLNWVFNTSEDKLRSIYSKIPNDIDIIVSHGPPYGYGDLSTYSNNYGEHVGSRALLEKIIEIQPRLVVTGHIHAAYGIYEVGLTKVINCAIVNDEYKLVRGPIYVEL
jgi:Icc-related predicted phosphoesterase